jgi:murein DD-endopeptidase MepM/ murein hydrolase activator NlpD
MVRSKLLGGIANWLRMHAAADRNSITVTIAPAQAERTFQIDLPRWSLRLLGAILVASFVLVLVGGVLYGKLIRDAVVLREVKQENEILRARAARLEEIESDVAQLDRVRRQLYAIAGVQEAEAGSVEQTGSEVSAARAAASGDGAIASDAGESASIQVVADSPLTSVPIRGPISRGFGVASGRSPEHSGVDVAGREGADVAAAGDGTVAFAGQDETFGNMLIIRHADGWETRYGHNEQLLVAQGDSVHAGQVIALLGSTGKSSAPHLHFEIHHDGTAVDPGIHFPVYRSRF